MSAGVYLNKFNEYFLWDGVDSGMVIWDRTESTDLSPSRAGISPQGGVSVECHWTQKLLDVWLTDRRLDLWKIENSCPRPYITRCAECSQGLFELDYLCSECRT